MPLNRTSYLLIIAALLFVIAPRLLAPIQEMSESPTPKPKAQNGTKPRPKAKPTATPNEARKSTTKPQKLAMNNRFAGTWVGTMPEVPWGNVATELIIDQTGTTMQWQESGTQKGTSPAQISGNTIQANFQIGVAETWSLTLLGDGTTARVRLQAFMNDQTAVFHRVAGGGGTTKQMP